MGRKTGTEVYIHKNAQTFAISHSGLPQPQTLYGFSLRHLWRSSNECLKLLIKKLGVEVVVRVRI
jgi:hypothetical protein